MVVEGLPSAKLPKRLGDGASPKRPGEALAVLVVFGLLMGAGKLAKLSSGLLLVLKGWLRGLKDGFALREAVS